MTDTSIVRNGVRLRRPSIVSDIINMGLYGRLALLRTDPSCIFKFCSDNPEAIASLEQEKRIYAILGPHRFIANLLWVSERGLCFEYYPLGSLRSYYRTLLPDLPPLSDRVRWCHQLVEEVAYIHSKNIIHNDITADNVLLSNSMDIKICDFGFASMVGEEPTGGTETRYYRVSLFSEGQSCVVDDLFSMSSLFYEIILGSRPYEDFGSTEVLKKYKERVFSSLEIVKPESYANVISKCWNEQYQAIPDLQNDLPPLIMESTSPDNLANSSGDAALCSIDVRSRGTAG